MATDTLPAIATSILFLSQMAMLEALMSIPLGKDIPGWIAPADGHHSR
jgi:hypothetical protein